MKRHLRLYRAFWRNCLRQAVEFRVNFWSNVLSNIGWLFSLVLFMKLIYLNTQSVAGWSEGEMFVLIGTYSTLRGVTDTLFYSNLANLPDQMRRGTLDFVLLRPVNSQFYMSLRYVALDNIGQFAGAVAILAYGVSRVPHAFTAAHVGLFLFLMLCAVILFYSISLIVMTLSFWLIRLENLFVALDTTFSLARTPIDVFRAFGRGPQFVLTYILPVAFLAAMPVKALFGRASPAPVAGIAVLLASLFFSISVAFWRFATRSYASASS
ncbi:MAG: ABC transporter permease [Capsulimonadaceae bacterium]